MASMSAGKWNGTFYFNLESTVDTSLVNSTGSVIEDITNTIKVGQDTNQSKESEYNKAETSTTIKVSAVNKNGENLNATANNIVGKDKEDLLNSLGTSGLVDITEVKANLAKITVKKQKAIDKVNATMKLLGL